MLLELVVNCAASQSGYALENRDQKLSRKQYYITHGYRRSSFCQSQNGFCRWFASNCLQFVHK
jgi:hypothetical protein